MIEAKNKRGANCFFSGKCFWRFVIFSLNSYGTYITIRYATQHCSEKVGGGKHWDDALTPFNTYWFSGPILQVPEVTSK